MYGGTTTVVLRCSLVGVASTLESKLYTRIITTGRIERRAKPRLKSRHTEKRYDNADD
jgi:hypothetical protein